LPFKSKKIKISYRFFNYLVFEDEDLNTVIQKRDQKGIWHNLYEFPLIETETEVDFDEISGLISDKYSEQYSIKAIFDWNSNGKIHKLSHQHLNIKFWKVKVKGTIKEGITAQKLKTFPFPIVIFNFIQKEFSVLT
jgi:A/G-specific adenine glycosylase